jgi:hypothetical protein
MHAEVIEPVPAPSITMTPKEISEATLYADEGDWLAASERLFGC